MKDKAKLLTEAGFRVFPRVGYHRATVEDILSEAGVARSTFYSYFSNKRELFITVVRQVMDEILQSVYDGITQIVKTVSLKPESGMPGEMEQLLTSFMRSVFELIARNRGMTRIFFNELLGIDEEITSLFQEFQEKLTEMFEQLIDFGVEIGVVRSDVSRNHAAEFIIGGLLHLVRNFTSGLKEYNLDEISREFVGMQIYGLYAGGRDVDSKRVASGQKKMVKTARSQRRKK
jgi:AcrR family transcriptional regulator